MLRTLTLLGPGQLWAPRTFTLQVIRDLSLDWPFLMVIYTKELGHPDPRRLRGSGEIVDLSGQYISP